MSDVIERGYNLPSDHFTTIPNSWLRDAHLSRRARGLHHELMSHRPGWSTSVATLAAAGLEGQAAIKKDLRELEKHGYLRREWTRDDKGRRTGNRYILTDPAKHDQVPPVDGPPVDSPPVETPSSTPSVDSPPVDRPPVGNPAVGNPAVANHAHKNNIHQEDQSSFGEENEGGSPCGGTSLAIDTDSATIPPESNPLSPQDAAPPAAAPHCKRHPDGTDIPCRPCAAARQTREQWDQNAKDRATKARRAAIDACPWCDDNGMRNVPHELLDEDPPIWRCDHTPVSLSAWLPKASARVGAPS